MPKTNLTAMVQYQVMHLDRIKFIQGLQKSKLIILLVILFSSFSGKNGPVAKVPFENISGWTCIKILLNQKDTLNFIFDTGCETSVIDTDIADSIQLVQDGTLSVSGATGSAKAKKYKKNMLQIGNIQLKNVMLIGTSLMHLSLIAGVRLDGIIGNDLLSKFTVSVKQDEKEMLFFSPEQFHPDEKASKVEISRFFNGSLPIVQISCRLQNDQKLNPELIIDCGAASGISFFAGYSKENNINLKLGKTTTSNVSGLTNDIQLITTGRIKEIILGADTISGVPVTTTEASKGVFSSSNADGVLGNLVLRRFNITYDYKNRMIYVLPALDLHEKFKTNCIGLSIGYKDWKSKKIVITQIIAGSSSDQAGLKKNDEILSVNGKESGQFSLASLRKLLQQCTEKISLQIQHNNGNKMDVELLPVEMY